MAEVKLADALGSAVGAALVRRAAAYGSSPGEWLADCGTCRGCGALVPVATEGPNAGTVRDHRCCRCGDSGRVRVERRPSEPGFGTAELCVCVSAPGAGMATEEREQRFRRHSRVPQAFIEKSFASFSPADAIERQWAAWYVASWPPAKPLMLLSGDRGRGKTHLACAMLRAAWERHGKLGQFWPSIDLLDRYRATFDNDRATESVAEIDASLRRCPLLVLDDFGKEKATDFAAERLFRLIDERSRERLPLVVTTNVPLDALEATVTSRLRDQDAATLVPFSGPDRRVEG